MGLYGESAAYRSYGGDGRKNYETDSIAQGWARQESKSGKCPAQMTFDGARFYSYSTCIAERVQHNGATVYLVSEEQYSVSTARHLGKVRSAIGGGYPWYEPERRGHNGERIFIVPGLPRGGSELSDSRRILREWSGEAEWKLRDAAESRDPKKTRLLESARVIRNKMRAYAEFFGLDLGDYAVTLPVSDAALDKAIKHFADKQAAINAKSELTRLYNEELRRRIAHMEAIVKRLGAAPDRNGLMRTYETTHGLNQIADRTARLTALLAVPHEGRPDWQLRSYMERNNLTIAA